MQKAKVGIIIDNKFQPWNIKDLIEKSINSEIYEISCLIIQAKQPIKTKYSVKFKNFLFKFICFVEEIYVKRNPLYKKYYEKFDIDLLDVPTIKVNPIISKSGLIYRYSEYDLSQIKSQKLDLLIRGGSGILKGDILNVCKNGIISFHHGNNEIYRGSPPGFWEVMNRQNSTGFIIQILKEELDAGDVIFKGCIPTSSIYSLNRARLYLKANVFMHFAIENIVNGKKLHVQPKKPYDRDLFKVPSITTQLKYLKKTFIYFLKKRVRKLRNKKYQWGIAFQFINDWRDSVLWKSKKIINPKNRFLADPFLLSYKNKDYCFVEDYDFKKNKGSISVIEINKDNTTEPSVVLEEDFHLSYPYIFEHDNEIYMCPETHQANEIRLYKSVDFPNKWEFVKVLLSNVSAVDTNIFKLDNKWWMLTNIDSSNSGEYCSELHLFYSNTLFSDNWNPHPMNPIIFDSEKARNGGFIVDSGDFYRIYQKQGWDNYGESFGVSKITEINETNYAEVSEFEVSPLFFKNINGTHTYNYNNGIIVIDFSSIS